MRERVTLHVAQELAVDGREADIAAGPADCHRPPGVAAEPVPFEAMAA